LSGIEKRTDVKPDPAAGERNQGARVQNFRAVVRDLGGFAMMEMGNEPGIGHQARVCRQDAGNVFPQRDAARAERPRQKRCGQVRSTAPEGRRASIRCATDEARDDRHAAVREDRTKDPSHAAVCLRQVRRGAAMMAIGADDRQRIDEAGANAGASQSGRKNGCRDPLAARGEHVGGARCEVTQHRHGCAQLVVLTGRCVDRGEKRTPRRPARQNVADDVAMAPKEERRRSRGDARLAGNGLHRAAEQKIRDTRQSRGDDNEPPAMVGDEADGPADGRGVSERCASELPHLERRARPGRSGRLHHGLTPVGATR
jgi:hypothetical protein